MSKRIALVTGGTGGLGKAICKQLSDDGYQVIIMIKHRNFRKK